MPDTQSSWRRKVPETSYHATGYGEVARCIGDARWPGINHRVSRFCGAGNLSVEWIGGDGVANAWRRRGRIEEAKSAAKNLFVRYAIGKSRTRPKVKPVRSNQAAASPSPEFPART